MSYNNVGKVWSLESFEQYLKTIKPPSWVKGICFHHCAEPSLAQRPKGFQIQHIINMQEFYKSKGWRSGPHLYTDEDQIFGMTPLTETGVHAVAFNKTTIGIEALGNYSKGEENPKSGRGLEVWKTTAQTAKLLYNWLGIKPTVKTMEVYFHRDDPNTSKDCPGVQVTKEWLISMINSTVEKPDAGQKIIAAKNMIPLVDAIKKKGYNSEDIAKNLRREGSNFFWKQDFLEFAYYDAKLETTFAPLSEINEIPNK